MAEEINGGVHLRQKTDHLVDKAIDTTSEGLERVRSSAHDAVAATDDVLAQARDYITTNAQTRPLATAATAAGIGLLIGMLITRR